VSSSIVPSATADHHTDHGERAFERHLAAIDRRRPMVRFTDEVGDETTGRFLGVDPDQGDAVMILVGGTVQRRRTRLTVADRVFSLAVLR
jgi:hypothetical protein